MRACLVLAFASLVTVRPLAAQTPPAAAPPEIRAAATAQRSVTPDLATITLQFTADGATPLVAGQRLAARADSLRQALGHLGIAADSIITGSRWYWWSGRIELRVTQRCVVRPEGRGCDMVPDTAYRAHENFQVRTHTVDRVGAVIDTALAHGVTDISNVQFHATDISAAQDAALRDATAKARHQAEAMASASGVELGRIISLSTQSDNGSFAINPFQYSLSSASEREPGTVVTKPSVSVSVTVFGRWELKQK